MQEDKCLPRRNNNNNNYSCRFVLIFFNHQHQPANYVNYVKILIIITQIVRNF